MSVKIQKGEAAGLINLTPMIDVVFQLLLFFLVASKFADEERETRVVLPQASEAKAMVAKPKEYFINIDREGRFIASAHEVSAGELEKLLRQAAVNNPGRQSVVIRADKHCPWEKVVVAINLCNKVGIRDHRESTAEPQAAAS